MGKGRLMPRGWGCAGCLPLGWELALCCLPRLPDLGEPQLLLWGGSQTHREPTPCRQWEPRWAAASGDTQEGPSPGAPTPFRLTHPSPTALPGTPDDQGAGLGAPPAGALPCSLWSFGTSAGLWSECVQGTGALCSLVCRRDGRGWGPGQGRPAGLGLI